MLDFLRRNRVLLMAGLGLLVAAGLVTRSGRAPTRDDRLGRFFLEVMAPLQGATTTVGRAVGTALEGVTSLVHARDENVALRARLRTLQADVDRLREVELENERLRHLLDFRETMVGDFVTARVIGRDAQGRPRTLVIDRGERDGVAKGAAVLAPEGLVGQIALASPHAARVLLISDHNSGVDALVQRTRVHGIVQGTLDDGCILKYVKRTEDVQVGDAVISSGLDGIFPKGMPVGTVTAVDKGGQGLFQNAEVAPRVDFEQLEEVLVPRGPVEPREPEPPPTPTP
ncbi:MAG TPA: rod shape-determining protein MreC [Candidatus Binatia bacterium]|nr:rod shape-determining protein MreC [Candidatus Binatia bacterium]